MSAGDWKDLYAAAQTGDLARVRHHIQEGVNPDYQHPEVLCTPLVASLVHGHGAVARYLLEHGASPTLRSDFDDMTPLQAAQRFGREDIVALLKARGAAEERRPFWWRWLPL
ncbi:ankyrin repeat domain-containing protein [Paracidovorax wautersii]|uniref:Ankyrin repeat protein n=1 Tax=Paracidovorax wautersii TaxID=1177982 RepID=A0ABU1IDR7_9BURK|nr:ankyrin repeat domain-containing protein [Paracidovorax wautersii]MDR6214937.1 ankyrin repeat protein [Paracidovorax wautersii]